MRVLARLWSISEEVSVSGVLLGFVVWCVWHHIFTPVAVFLSSFGDCLSSTFDNGAASSLDSFAASDLSDWPLPHPSWWRTCLEITWGTFWFSEDDQSTPFLLWSCGLRYQLHYIHYIHYSIVFSIVLLSQVKVGERGLLMILAWRDPCGKLQRSLEGLDPFPMPRGWATASTSVAPNRWIVTQSKGLRSWVPIWWWRNQMGYQWFSLLVQVSYALFPLTPRKGRRTGFVSKTSRPEHKVANSVVD